MWCGICGMAWAMPHVCITPMSACGRRVRVVVGVDAAAPCGKIHAGPLLIAYRNARIVTQQQAETIAAAVGAL